MSEIYLIAGALLLSGAVVLAFSRPTAGTVCAYAGAWAMRGSGYSPVASSLLLFWAVAVLIVISIDMLRRGEAPLPMRMRCFIVAGSLAGMAVGLTLYQAGAILGAAVGALLGAIAYGGLSHIRDIRAVARQTVAFGLPTVVTMSLIAIALQGLLARNAGI